MVPEELLLLARRLASAGRGVTLAGFAEGLGYDNKAESGFDPVTRADRECEAVLRRLIEETFPDHGISGEEMAERIGTGRWSWSLDPIDGTRAYICGIPLWTTLIALLDEGRPVLGLIDAPCLGEFYLGHGVAAERVTAAGREPIAASGCGSIAEARLSTTDPHLFGGAEAERFERVRRRARLTRFGLDAYGYALVAAGRLDLVIESGLKPHDYHALIPVVRAAGGMIGDWDGGDDFSAGAVIAAATRPLYEQAVEAMR